MPAEDGQLTRHGDRRDLMAAMGADAQEETRVTGLALWPRPRLPQPGWHGRETPRLHQLLRAGKAAHIADCRHDTGGTIRLTPLK